MATNKIPNRLINEKSPYLLQHAYNPVNWYPWGEEAFALAKKEDKPIFMSIGYSTCHWCHVMAHESFEDNDVAEALNRDFIAIKVDREERPDIDAVYMKVCQALTGAGGWPLSVLMTPDQKPFWAGTYLPKTSSYGGFGIMELLAEVKRQWDIGREKLLESGDRITSFLKQSEAKGIGRKGFDKTLLKEAVKAFENSYDSQWGGFGSMPKFPIPHELIFLMRYSVLVDDDIALKMAEHTLEQMYRGGIFDHVGGGFSRYSTDEKWLVPHFEKMLYDNALLILANTEAYAITGRRLYRRIAENTAEYVLRELTDNKGAFYCGQDADSQGEEGSYYLFTKGEIEEVLGREDSNIFCRWFGITEAGNFEGRNILNLLDNQDYEKDNGSIMGLAKNLYEYRLKRMPLHKDDKVLTSWSSLMIAALAKAGRIFESQAYTAAAKRAQSFIKEKMTGEDGGLRLRWREGEAAYDGQIDDYAFYAFALLELYQTTFGVYFLKEAADVAEKMLMLFRDEEKGGLFLYSKEGEQLISRPKQTYDGAIPSGNAVAAEVLERLWKLTGEIKWRKEAGSQLAFLADDAWEYPMGHSMALTAALNELYASEELVCVTAEEQMPQDLLAFLRDHAIAVLLKTPENGDELAKVAPFTSGYPVPQKGTVCYLCRDGACAAPVDSLSALTILLKEGRKQ
ncbi:MAG: thioredoxin domain-containing protein [Clostridiaceae bacterium]|nr:thioredoxin domain-containing protein [Clostridiaceae bacterium]